jgi:hypothetical protein
MQFRNAANLIQLFREKNMRYQRKRSQITPVLMSGRYQEIGFFLAKESLFLSSLNLINETT